MSATLYWELLTCAWSTYAMFDKKESIVGAPAFSLSYAGMDL